MEQIITTLIVIAVIALAGVAAVTIIRRKLNQTTRKYLGMGLDETAKLIRDGIKEEASAPKPISSMTAVYKPKLLRDFPETSYEQIEQMARNALSGYLAAITAADISKLFAPSRNLTQQAQNHIDGNLSRGVSEKFEQLKIHKTSMSDYKSAEGVADAEFEISFEAFHGGQQPEQFACAVLLNSGRAEADDSESAVFTMTCPNCGAPLKVAGKDTVCRYCGSGISERGTRVWLADSVKFI